MDDKTNSREASEIVLAVRKATFLMDPFFKLTMTGAALLLTYLARMQKERKLNRGEFASIQEFIKATDGKYFIVNIPVEDGKPGQERFEKELEKLKELGVRYKVMPDLNKGDGYQQLIVYENDRELFNGWHERYLISQMKGGEHSLQGIKSLANENVSIVSIPFEGKEDVILGDLDKMGVNYAVLPDLKVGDGEIQLVIANADMPKVEHWYNLYMTDQLKKGIYVPEMKNMDMNSYKKSGEMTEEQYIGTASEDLKKANEKYEGKEQGAIEKSVMKQENQTRDINDEAYIKYHENTEYLEITIDTETFVENCHIPEEAIKAFDERGYFVSRVPKTWMRGTRNAIPERCLLVPKEQVFLTDNGQTYIAFLHKNENPSVVNLNGKQVSVPGCSTGKELYEKYYEEVTRGFKEKKQLTREVEKTDKVAEKANGKTAGRTASEATKTVGEKTPKPPTKALL